MGIYDDMAADVAEILEELGRPVVFNRYTSSNSLVAGTAAPSISVTQTLDTATVPYSAAGTSFNGLDISFMDSVQDATEKKLGIVTALGSTFVPAPKDKAVFDGKTWNVIGCTPINVNGTGVVFIVGLVLP